MKKYITPEVEITVFDTEDIITSSGMNDGGVNDGSNEPGTGYDDL